MSQLTVVMYHYVREIQESRYPGIKGLERADFVGQLDYLQKYYHFVTLEECLAALDSGASIPKNSVALTFDDGFVDHYQVVFPLLKARGIEGWFFPPAEPILKQKVLDVHKLHFILALAPIEEVFEALRIRYEKLPGLTPWREMVEDFRAESRFDSKQVLVVKRLLQRDLAIESRSKITHELFNMFVTHDEAAFSRQLYMSPDQLREMAQAGMQVGSHGFSHVWLNFIDQTAQSIEVDRSLDFLESVGTHPKKWMMCYPYGGYNDSLIEVLEQRSCALGFSTRPGIASLSEPNRLKLERLDTNDLPKSASFGPNEWTRQVMA